VKVKSVAVVPDVGEDDASVRRTSDAAASAGATMARTRRVAASRARMRMPPTASTTAETLRCDFRPTEADASPIARDFSRVRRSISDLSGASNGTGVPTRA
jgi:hypothetical protein